MSGASGALKRALVAHAAAERCSIEIVSVDARDWASATFTGEQHRIVLRACSGATLSTWLAGLPEAEWRLPGHIVACLSAEARGDEATVLALTIAES